MDLTRLYNLTTPELREEAERLGVLDTYAMSRGQLIHAIRSRAGGQESEGLLGKVLGFAKWALQAAQEETRKDPASQPPRRGPPATPTASAPEVEAKRFGRPAEVPMPSLGGGAESVAVAGAAPGAVSGAVSGAAPGAVAGAAPVAAAVSGAAPVAGAGAASVSGAESGADSGADFGAESESASATESSSGPPSRPPVGVFSKTSSMFDEPFPTLTMARILAEQGHFKRALAIYATLLQDEPGNGEVRAEADEIRAQSRVRRSQVN